MTLMARTSKKTPSQSRTRKTSRKIVEDEELRDFNIPQLKQKITIQSKKLDDKQLRFLEKSLHENTNLMFVVGPAGAAKTYMAVYSALRILSSNDDMDLLYIRTPVEASERSMGFLPGNVEEKFDPYLWPLQDKLDEFLPKEKSTQSELLKEGRISGMPNGFVRGADWKNKVVVCDEAQNFTYDELKTLITRVGENSRLFLCGDLMQSDIGRKSGLKEVMGIFSSGHWQKSEKSHVFEFEVKDIKRCEFVMEAVQSFIEHEIERDKTNGR